MNATLFKKVITAAISRGWTKGEDMLTLGEIPPCSRFIFEPGFGRAFWGEELIPLRDIKTTRGQTISEEAWRFHQHILLDFIQIAREDLIEEYLEQFLPSEKETT